MSYCIFGSIVLFHYNFNKFYSINIIITITLILIAPLLKTQISFVVEVEIYSSNLLSKYLVHLT